MNSDPLAPGDADEPAADGLHNIIGRSPHLTALRDGLAIEFQIWSVKNRKVEALLDLATVATAIWYRHLARCDPHAAVYGGVVEHLLALLDLRRPGFASDIAVLNGRARCAATPFWALVDNDRLLEAAVRTYFKLPAGIAPAVAEALILPPRLGVNWEAAVSPLALVRYKAKLIETVEWNNGGEIPKRDAMFCGNVDGIQRGTVPIDTPDEDEDLLAEVVVDALHEALLERTFTHVSLARLQQSVEGDADLAIYIDTWLMWHATPERIAPTLGWTSARAARVGRRFRRLRALLKQDSDLAETVAVPPTPFVSMASKTWYLERSESGYAVYQHVKPRPSS